MTSPFNHLPQSQGGHLRDDAPEPRPSPFNELELARVKMAELAAKHDAVIDRLIEDVQRLRDLRRESIGLAVKIEREECAQTVGRDGYFHCATVIRGRTIL
jgi:hypothetical protein